MEKDEAIQEQRVGRQKQQEQQQGSKWGHPENQQPQQQQQQKQQQQPAGREGDGEQKYPQQQRLQEQQQQQWGRAQPSTNHEQAALIHTITWAQQLQHHSQQQQQQQQQSHAQPLESLQQHLQSASDHISLHQNSKPETQLVKQAQAEGKAATEVAPPAAPQSSNQAEPQAKHGHVQPAPPTVQPPFPSLSPPPHLPPGFPFDPSQPTPHPCSHLPHSYPPSFPYFPLSSSSPPLGLHPAFHHYQAMLGTSASLPPASIEAPLQPGHRPLAYPHPFPMYPPGYPAPPAPPPSPSPPPSAEAPFPFPPYSAFHPGAFQGPPYGYLLPPSQHMHPSPAPGGQPPVAPPQGDKGMTVPRPATHESTSCCSRHEPPREKAAFPECPTGGPSGPSATFANFQCFPPYPPMPPGYPYVAPGSSMQQQPLGGGGGAAPSVTPLTNASGARPPVSPFSPMPHPMHFASPFSMAMPISPWMYPHGPATASGHPISYPGSCAATQQQLQQAPQQDNTPPLPATGSSSASGLHFQGDQRHHAEAERSDRQEQEALALRKETSQVHESPLSTALGTDGTLPPAASSHPPTPYRQPARSLECPPCCFSPERRLPLIEPTNSSSSEESSGGSRKASASKSVAS
eukprot:TRINITY_DN1495_c0_g1_i1.p1 TRINITY_DN1495_c0_g1~~TRINITY_DN1495_c0_g1_i1.p1  ORF type:complete len:689 (+),score=159.19 TRINITY_DN1495_c0_g1_i1:181-2067(+)